MAEANTAIYFTPISTAVSIPFAFGTKHGYETPGCFFMFWNNYFELAICGTHLGDTNEPTYIVFKPLYERLLINLVLSSRLIIFFSF